MQSIVRLTCQLNDFSSLAKVIAKILLLAAVTASIPVVTEFGNQSMPAGGNRPVDRTLA